MGVAALYDIHGNIDALEAVLNEIDSHGIDQIVIGGDIAWGPFPAQTVARTQELGERVRAIRGNADRELVSPPEVDEPGWITEVTRWCLDQLSPEQQGFLSALPLTTTVTVEGMEEVLFCHATPRSDDEIFTAITPEVEIVPLLAGVDARLVVCGHTHSQFDRAVGRHRVVNVGSVGMPYEDAPGAYWAIFDEEVELRRTDYDFVAAAERVRKSGCPHGEGFADAILSPAGRDETIAEFEHVRTSRET